MLSLLVHCLSISTVNVFPNSCIPSSLTHQVRLRDLEVNLPYEPVCPIGALVKLTCLVSPLLCYDSVYITHSHISFERCWPKKNILLIFYIFSGARQCRIDAKLFTALVKAFFNLDMKYLWILVQKKNASLTHSRTNMYEGFPNKKDAAGLSVKLSKTVFYYFWQFYYFIPKI